MSKENGSRIAFLPHSDVLQGSKNLVNVVKLLNPWPSTSEREGKSTSYGIILTRSFANSMKRTWESGWTYVTGFPVCLFGWFGSHHSWVPCIWRHSLLREEKMRSTHCFPLQGLMSVAPLLHRIAVHVRGLQSLTPTCQQLGCEARKVASG